MYYYSKTTEKFKFKTTAIASLLNSIYLLDFRNQGVFRTITKICDESFLQKLPLKITLIIP